MSALILLMGPMARGQQAELDWGPVLDCNMAGEGGLRPRIALNGDGQPVVLWGRNNPASNHVAIGTGTAFGPPFEVSMPGCVPAVADWMGSGIASFGNTVLVVMKATPEESRPLYVRRSDDGGVTWGDTVRVDAPTGLVSRFPSVAVGDPDHPVVQYMEFDSGYFGARQVTAYFNGLGFDPPVQVSTPFAPGDVCDCCPNQVEAYGDRVVALYRHAAGDQRVLWGATSDDGGETFPTGALLDTTGWNFNACPSSGPDAYLTADSVHYVWMSGANNGTKVYVGSADAAGLGQGPQRLVHPGQPLSSAQNFPRIAGNADTLGIVWQQNRSGQQEILFAWSVAGTGALSEPDTVNVTLSGAQRTPDIAFANGTFHIIWSDGSTQVRYRRVSIVDAVGLAEQELASVKLWPDPVQEELMLGGAWTEATVLDLQGRVVLRGAVRAGRLAVRDLPAATYVLRVTDARGHVARASFRKL